MSALSDPVGMLPEEWQEAMLALGEKAFRGKQLFEWIHHRGVMDPEAMTNLSKALRATLTERGMAAPLVVERVHGSTDGSRKLLLRMSDALTVETVLLPLVARALAEDADVAAADDDDERSGAARVTQCISSQVGCAMGCVFCASGMAGLTRHMSAGEIVGQILLGRANLEAGEKLGNVVFMGMGEPLHNYAAVARAIRLLTHPDGLGMSPRRLTVSTSGLVPEIDRLARDFSGKIGLAVSLHAASDERRSALMPVNKRHPLRELIGALRRYPLPRGRRITIEYTLVAGQNDSHEDATALARLMRGLSVKINLIPMNPIACSALGPPTMERTLRFQQVLTRADHLCFVRRRRGDDVAAACGQLALKSARPTTSFVKRQPRRT